MTFDEALSRLKVVKAELATAEDERVSAVRAHGICTVNMNNAHQKCKDLSDRVKELERALLACV